ncbi:phosphatidate cytidylyltransferase [Cyanobacteria bacterium FACHB-63]|nr:phosphatidate cytidylyltransferase [Cyanobacteria bacterium FACHB-63]
MRDGAATLLAFGVAISWLRLIELLAARGRLESKLSRKLIHIGTGPLFVLCWQFFSAAPAARYFAALVPLVLTGQFLAIGLEWIQNPQAVQAMTRTGKPAEILRGPLYYGIVFTVCTIVFWRHSPIGILALMILCGGDGLADIVGRRFGSHKLFFNAQKSWAGSLAMFVGSFAFGFGFLALFNNFQNFYPALDLATTARNVAAISLVATIVEALPYRDIDNITLTAVAILLGLWLF